MTLLEKREGVVNSYGAERLFGSDTVCLSKLLIEMATKYYTIVTSKKNTILLDNPRESKGLYSLCRRKGRGEKLGRIRPNFIKRIAREVVKRHRDQLSIDYYKNREFLETILTFSNERLRNRVSGYVTTLMKQKPQSERAEYISP